MTTLKHRITKFCQIWTAYSYCSPIQWVHIHHLLWPHSQFRSHDFMLKSTHINCWPLSTDQWWKIIIRIRQWNNERQSTSLPLIRKCTCIRNCQQNTQNLARKNQILIKYMQTLSHSWPNKNNVAPIINQYPGQHVSSTPWLMALYTTKCKNSSIKWDPSISFHLKRNQSIIIIILRTSPQQHVLMAQKFFLDKNSK